MPYPLKLGSEEDFISLPTPPASPINSSPITPSSSSPTQIGPYRILSLLGNGTFGAVHRAVDKRSTIDPTTGKQRVVAVKFVRKGQVTRAGLLEEQLLRHEAATLQRVHDDSVERLSLDGRSTWTEERERIARSRIVTLLDVLDTPEYFATVMELAEGGELHDRLISSEGEGDAGSVPEPQGLQEALAKKIFKELAQAVAYLHHKNISHRDLKLENILLTSHSHVKLGDFGLSLPFDPTSPNTAPRAGSDPYLSPEVVLHRPTVDLRASDAWAMGVVLYAMLTARMPFSTDEAAFRAGVLAADGFGRDPGAVARANSINRRKMYARIATAAYSLTEEEERGLSKEAKDLLGRLLCKNPEERFTAEQVLGHPWIAGGGSGWELDEDERVECGESSGQKGCSEDSILQLDLDMPWHVRISSHGELTFADWGTGNQYTRGGWGSEAFAALAGVVNGNGGFDFGGNNSYWNVVPMAR